MEDLIKSIKATLYERTNSPLSGAFIGSWLLWNYKFVLALWIGKDYAEKTSLSHIALSTPAFALFTEANLSWGWQILNCAIIPLTLAGAYIFFYPSLGNHFYKKHLNNKTKLSDIRSQSESNFLSNEQARDLITLNTRLLGEIDNLSSKFIQRSALLQKENERVKARLKNLVNQDIDENTFSNDILRFIQMNPSCTLNQIVSDFGLPESYTEKTIETLKKENKIEISRGEYIEDLETYTVTDIGREYLISIDYKPAQQA